MMSIEHWQPNHIHEIELDEDQRIAVDSNPHLMANLNCSTIAYTGRIDNQIIACVGLIDCSDEHGVLWSFISKHASTHRFALHRAAKRLLPLLGKNQLQATADSLKGCAWLERLGFVAHDSLPKYGLDGKDHLRYVRNF